MSQNIDLSKAIHDALTDSIEHLQLLPVAGLKLLQLTHDENAGFSDLSKVIETEPNLTAEILATVNSAYYALPTKVNSIQQAVSLLGFSKVRVLALKLSLYNQLIKQSGSVAFNLTFFWQHCLFVAEMSRQIGILMEYPDPDLLYTGGLIHDIGKLILESYGKRSYSEFIDFFEQQHEKELLECEESFFGANHQQIGKLFCRQSNFPDVLTEISAHHHLDDLAYAKRSDYVLEIGIISLANYLAWWQGLGSIDSNKTLHLSPIVSSIIEVERLDLDALLNTVDREMQTIAQVYQIKFPSINELRNNLIHRAVHINHRKVSELIDWSLETDGVDDELKKIITIPHQSLEPEIFVPRTLSAIQKCFKFDRVCILNMTAKYRKLVSKYCWPEDLSEEQSKLEIKVDFFSDMLIDCLRMHRPALITKGDKNNHPLLTELGVEAFIAVPIIRNHRLSAVLYADNCITGKTLSEDVLEKIVPISNELGSALYNAKRFELEKNKAELDSLTGLLNKRMIVDFVETHFNQAPDERERLALGFLDLDYFKKLNDDCGHQMGDNALRIVANILRSLTRDVDCVGRYGGEEFVFVLTDTDRNGALQFAERIRLMIEHSGKNVKQDFRGHELTASIGIAFCQPEFENYQELIYFADKAMYMAKNEGRNQVVSWPTPDHK